MNKFKIEDKVKIIENSFSSVFKIGKIVEVYSLEKNFSQVVCKGLHNRRVIEQVFKTSDLKLLKPNLKQINYKFLTDKQNEKNTII